MAEFDPWGVGFFDAEFGGLPRGRTALLTGRRGAGKTIATLQFIHAALSRGQTASLVVDAPAEAYLLYAMRAGLALEPFIRKGQCHFLTAHDFPVPPEGQRRPAEALAAAFAGRKSQRIAVDTMLPWICPPDDPVDDTIQSLLSAFSGTGATLLLTLPSPASTPARNLRRAVERICQTSVTITLEGRSASRVWEVSKFENRSVGAVMRGLVQPGLGFVRETAAQEADERRDIAAIADARRATTPGSWRPLVDRPVRAPGLGVTPAEGSAT